MYQGHDGKLTLFNKERKIIAIGTKLTQNLYKFSFEIIKQEYISQSIYVLSSQPVQGWEVWHKCYGHVNCYRLPNPGPMRSLPAYKSTQTLAVCVSFLFCLTPSCLSQMASNAGGVACPVVSIGCALLSFPIPNVAPSCFEVLPVCVP